jgi:prefoldin subunit 5
MTSPASDPARWEAELHALRQELTELRTEQRAIARSVAELAQTFRQLATHLGIAAEPYARRSASHEREHDLPGFG